MRFARWLAFGVTLMVASALGLGLFPAVTALTQGQQSTTVTLTFTNVCEVRMALTQIVLRSGLSVHVSIQRIELPTNQPVERTFQLQFTPQQLALVGEMGGQGFKAEIDPLPYNQAIRVEETDGCLQVLATLAGQQPPTTPSPTPPGPGAKPIAPGMDLNQVLAALQARGVPVRQEGSQSKPKLGDVSDPMLLRAIPGFSAQLVWVSAPGSLRSVIAWDNPAVDLDLIVFGFFPFGFCFQLTPPGVLAELCDRPPFGPVAGTVFAVLVINWSPTPQAYVLSLSP